MTRRSGVSRFISRLSAEVEIALWAGLAAFVIFFCALIAPNIPENVATAERVRALEIADENHRYCVKWGKAERTQAHAACVLDLQELRATIEQRRADAIFF
jgi:hypothetical protein